MDGESSDGTYLGRGELLLPLLQGLLLLPGLLLSHSKMLANLGIFSLGVSSGCDTDLLKLVILYPQLLILLGKFFLSRLEVFCKGVHLGKILYM